MGHYCGQVGCWVVLPRGVKRCRDHERKPWQSSQPVKRVTGRRLQELRLSLWTSQGGKCNHCQRVILPSEGVRDHIVPLAEGSIDQPSNKGCQFLCHSCSDIKTKAEQQRGRQRTKA